MVVPDPPAVDPHAAHLAVEDIVGGDESLFQSRRGGQHLESRTRFDEVADGEVAKVLQVAGGARVPVRVEARPVRHGQDLARAGPHQDDSARLGLGFPDCPLEFQAGE